MSRTSSIYSLAFFACLALHGCSGGSPLVGKWKDTVGNESLDIRSNGTYSETRVDPKIGTFHIDGRYDASANQLTLAAQDLTLDPIKGHETAAARALATPGLKEQMLASVNGDNPLKYVVVSPDEIKLTRPSGGSITLDRVKSP